MATETEERGEAEAENKEDETGEDGGRRLWLSVEVRRLARASASLREMAMGAPVLDAVCPHVFFLAVKPNRNHHCFFHQHHQSANVTKTSNPLSFFLPPFNDVAIAPPTPAIASSSSSHCAATNHQVFFFAVRSLEESNSDRRRYFIATVSSSSSFRRSQISVAAVSSSCVSVCLTAVVVVVTGEI
ncbi:hypothetical protein PIB30_013815 [Stylosanthes scabra]|uniref:Uncharacterized protein n=1 Tax=Stylosanthes scabra TaxID=79078 RepID=A0ABU6S6D6_9FABA|nr:hypothetical protein [Stylosanthes scabra]